jgi:hypothetical protein
MLLGGITPVVCTVVRRSFFGGEAQFDALECRDLFHASGAG